MKNHALTLPGAILLLVVTACSHRKTETPSQPPVIDVAEAVTDSVMLHASFPGYLQADKTIDIVARVSGTLLTKNYTSGDRVNKGQLLFTIESTKYADAVEQAQAALATARSSYDYASSHYAAVKKALESNAVSQMEVNQAKSAMDQAAASIKSAEAQLQTARTNLSYCRVYAPVTGRISSAMVDAGSYVAGEGAPVKLATIYDDRIMEAVFSVDNPAGITPPAGTPASLDSIFATVGLTFEEPLTHTYTGRLSYTGPAMNKSTGTLQMRAEVQNPWGELRDGMYVTISVPTANDARAVVVRDASIGTDQLGRFMYVVGDSDKVVYTPVKISEAVGDSLRIITSGIKAGDRYVTKALLKVRDGMKVTPRPTHSAR